MKFKINLELFHKRVEHALKLTADSNTVGRPIAIKTGQGQIEIYANSGVIYYKGFVPCEVIEPGEVSVDMSVFRRVFQGVPGTLTFEIKRNKLVSSGFMNLEIPIKSLPVSTDFPLPGESELANLSVNASRLSYILADAMSPVVFFQNHVVAIDPTEAGVGIIETMAGVSRPVYVPGAVASMSNSDGRFILTEDRVWFEADEFIVTSTTFNPRGVYTVDQWNGSIIPDATGTDNFFSCGKSHLISMVSPMSRITEFSENGGWGMAKFVVKDGVVTVEIPGSEAGEGNVEIQPLAVKGDFEVAFLPKRLIQAVDACDGPDITVFAYPNKMLVKTEDDPFCAIVAIVDPNIGFQKATESLNEKAKSKRAGGSDRRAAVSPENAYVET